MRERKDAKRQLHKRDHVHTQHVSQPLHVYQSHIHNPTYVMHAEGLSLLRGTMV